MNREKEQGQLLVELLGLVVQGLTNGRLHLMPGFESAVDFEGRHLARLVLDLRFDQPSAGAVSLPICSPSGGSSGAACLGDGCGRSCVAGVDVQAEAFVVSLLACAGQPRVTFSQQVDPPVGTPHVSSPRGNSAPSLAPVAGRADWLNPVVGG